MPGSHPDTRLAPLLVRSAGDEPMVLQAEALAESTRGRRPRSGLGGARSASVKPRTPPDGKRNFVAENIMDAGTHQKPATDAASDSAKYLHKANYGRVPTYLHDRKMELAAKYAKHQVRKISGDDTLGTHAHAVTQRSNLRTQSNVRCLDVNMLKCVQHERQFQRSYIVFATVPSAKERLDPVQRSVLILCFNDREMFEFLGRDQRSSGACRQRKRQR